MTPTDQKDRAFAALEVAQHVIALQIDIVLGAVAELRETPVAARVATLLYQYLHDQAATLEVMLVACGVDEDMLGAMVDAARGEVPEKVQQMRDGMERQKNLH